VLWLRDSLLGLGQNYNRTGTKTPIENRIESNWIAVRKTNCWPVQSVSQKTKWSGGRQKDSPQSSPRLVSICDLRSATYDLHDAPSPPPHPSVHSKQNKKEYTHKSIRIEPNPKNTKPKSESKRWRWRWTMMSCPGQKASPRKKIQDVGWPLAC